MAGEADNQGVKLSRRLGLPLHRQLALILAEQIYAGRYLPGAPLPTEAALRQLFGVSRVTVRAALQQLEMQHLIDRKQGVGTFVRIPSTRLRLHMGIGDKIAYMEEQRRHASLKLLHFDRAPAPPHVCEWFGCAPSTPFVHVVRLRVTSKPVLLLTTSMPEEVAGLFTEQELGEQPHYALMQRAGLNAATGQQIISATLADPITASHLELEAGEPLLRIRQLYTDDRQRPLRFLELLASPAEFEIHLSLDGPPIES